MSIELSIIVPIYNVEEYLEECLNSIYNINNINKEVILINDGSTDRSQVIVDKFKKRYDDITKVIIKKNSGLSSARNSGLNQAKGEYVLFIDSDDFIDSKKIEKLFFYARRNELDIAFGDLYHIKNKDVIVYKNSKRRENKLKKINVTDGMSFWDSCIEKKTGYIRVEVVTNIFKREMLNKYDIRFKEGLLHEDTLFMFVATFYAQRVKYYPINFYYYRLREGSIMHTEGYKNYLHKLFIAKELQEFKERNNIKAYSWNNMIFTLYFAALKNCNIKNEELYKKIKENKNLLLINKIKRLLINIYNKNARDIEVSI